MEEQYSKIRKSDSVGVDRISALMMEEQCSKRIKSNNNTDSDSVVGVDRISALPDCILADILSFLPTKEAIATSLLSKQWKFSWLDIHSLDFAFLLDSIDLTPSGAENMAFIRFVSRALLLIDGRRLLNKFSLVWETCVIKSHVICWIHAAITRNVSEINLYLDELNSCDLFKFPISAFNCDSLRSLQLYGIFFDYDTTVVCLPRLETLKLDLVRFTSEEAFDKLINGCPMLHYLKLRIYPDYNKEPYDVEEDFMYFVSSPSLRHLDIYVDKDDRGTLNLNTPSLEYLKLHGPISEIFVENSLSSLNQAFFNIQLNERRLLMSNKHDFPYNSIVEAVRALEHAKFLSLSAHVMRALNHVRIKKSTKFDSLVKLETEIFYCDWRSLKDLIRCSDNLQLLTITQGPELLDNNHRNRLKWTTPAKVPRCLSTSLRKIVFDGYRGSDEDGGEMIRYMLTNASVLEMMHITFAGKMNSTKFMSVQKIGECPIKSPRCVVKISGSMLNDTDLELCFTARPLSRRRDF